MLSIILTIIGHCAYGSTNAIWKNPNNEIGTLPLIIFRSFCCFLIFISIHFLLLNLEAIPHAVFSTLDLAETVGICAINYFGLFFFLQSMKHAPISNTIGYSKIGLIFGVLIGFFVYKQEISYFKLAVCFIIFIGVILIEKSKKTDQKTISKGFVYSILSRVIWATSFLFMPFINKLGAILFCSILELVVFSMSCLLFLVQPVKLNFKKLTPKLRTELALLVILGAIGTLSLNFALAKINIIVFAFLGLIEPILGLLISKFYHLEKLNKLQIAGICLGIAAAFILAITK